MRIAMVCDVLGRENNGTTIAAMNLIRYLKKRGHEVTVVCPDEDKRGQDGYVIASSLPLIRFLKEYVEKNGVNIAGMNKSLIEDVVRDADAVHVLLPFLLGHQAAVAAREMGKPLTASFHCQAENVTNHLRMMNVSRLNNEAYRVFWACLYKNCDCVHYPTEFIRETFENATHKTNSYVISNGVNARFRKMDAVRPPEWEGKFVILFSGRYSREKCHRVLLEAAGKSRYAGRLQLVLAGDGPLRSEIEEQAKSLPVPPVMKSFSREDMPTLINACDLYVHPAEIEIEAISCLEAIRCGLVPVIANSPRSATRAFALGPENLFAMGDSDNLAEKIDYWIDHPEEKARRSRDYLGYTDRFDQDTCMERMEEMIFDAVQMHQE